MGALVMSAQLVSSWGTRSTLLGGEHAARLLDNPLPRKTRLNILIRCDYPILASRHGRPHQLVHRVLHTHLANRRKGMSLKGWRNEVYLHCFSPTNFFSML